jgi:hypothetical protein
VLVGLTIFVLLAVPYGVAVDAKARNRTAADAAAIAGATGARDAALGSVGPAGVPQWSELPSAAGLGYAEAEEYAARNGGQLVSYYFDTVDGTAHATVESLDAEGRVARSEAVAQVESPSCEPLDLPSPPGRPGEGAGPGGNDPGDPQDDDRGPREPGRPLPEEVSVDCGSQWITFRVEPGVGGGVEVTLPPGEDDALRDVMPVRLVE